ncbi:preprotein translocase subunit YajC [Proteobacteria bacterium 005FR1]|nr:preprotein translocase subunit YajC [Proteobacteria bacterium 005FR1]
MDFLIPAAMAQAQTGQPAQSPWTFFIMMGGLFLFMYLFMIRPQQKRAKEHKELVSSLSKGDEVLLNSGLVGKVNKVDENYIVVEVADNTELKFQKVAVHAVLPKGTLKSI